MIISPKVKPFRFWSQKVLPLVYDDSLSYYEVLSKLTHKVNEVIETFNNKVVEVIEAYIPSIVAKATYNASTETITYYMEDNE